jgi:antirestriction protein ArdC
MSPPPQASCRSQLASWQALLQQAITTPGLIHEAYHRFHRYSLRNQLLAMAQCIERGIIPGPVATFKQWEALGRHVIRGQKALMLCMPITRARQATTDDTNATPANAATSEDDSSRVFFLYRARWFVLAQTDGEPYEPVKVPRWEEERALAAVGIVRVPFEHTDGNTQGYSVGRSIAISPVAALPHKTLFHEAAHVLLEHDKDETLPRSLREVEAEAVALLCCEALGLDGAVYARGYLQHWLQKDDLTDAMAQRIITTAHRILAAGHQGTTTDGWQQ